MFRLSSRQILALPLLSTLLVRPLTAQSPATQPVLRDVTQSIYLRPHTVDADQSDLELRDLFIHDITDEKGINITSTLRPDGLPWFYRTITLRNLVLRNISRSADGAVRGLHTDFIRICGGGDKQPNEANCLIEDVTIQDGNALPLLIQDGRFDTIILRRLRIQNTTIGAQIATINTGHIRRVLIEDCPGLRLALMGRPGSIETCIVRSSPGINLADTITRNGRTGVKIVHEPAPATLPLDDCELLLKGRRYRVVEQ